MKQKATPVLEKLNGSIESVTFHNPDNGFCVLRVKAKGRSEPVCVIGNAVTINPGEYIDCNGFWINDARFGLQFKAVELHLTPPTTIDGILKYLASGMIKGIGPHFAKRLIKTFGDEVFNVIEQEPDRLTEVEGIGKTRKEMITQAWQEQKTVRDIMVFLHTHSVGTTRAVRIYKTYGESAIATVRENPYQLALDIRGIGFKTADQLASSLGIPKDSPLRARAGVRHVLDTLCDSGHCAVIQETLIKQSVELLEIAETIIQAALTHELAERRIIQEEIDHQPYLYPAALYHAENSVAKHLKRLKQGATPWGELDVAKAIPWVEQKTGLTLSASQKAALTQALQQKTVIITGGPGVGKTTIVNSLLKIIQAKGIEIALCAPTGRAAKRLSESTHRPAKTIHRLLEFDPVHGGFKHDPNNPLAIHCLVVDEASMIDIVLMSHLLRALPDDAALILVGDVDQLPSVGPGAVLADCIQSAEIITVRLTEIFRQAASSKIVINAHRVNQGLLPQDNENSESDFFIVHAETPEEAQEKLFTVVTERIPNRFGFNPVHDIQVLTPMNRGGIGARALNVELQGLLNGKAGPRINRYGSTYAPGDKIIQIINNYQKEVFNGDIGFIRTVDLEEGQVVIEFDGRPVPYDLAELDEISLAYAITIHKSQGSEYPAVVIPILTQHYPMLAKNLLYTGITRGKRLVVVIGQKKAIAIAVKNSQAKQRMTGLKQRLRLSLAC